MHPALRLRPRLHRVPRPARAQRLRRRRALRPLLRVQPLRRVRRQRLNRVPGIRRKELQALRVFWGLDRRTFSDPPSLRSVSPAFLSTMNR